MFIRVMAACSIDLNKYLIDIVWICNVNNHKYFSNYLNENTRHLTLQFIVVLSLILWIPCTYGI